MGGLGGWRGIVGIYNYDVQGIVRWVTSHIKIITQHLTHPLLLIPIRFVKLLTAALVVMAVEVEAGVGPTPNPPSLEEEEEGDEVEAAVLPGENRLSLLLLALLLLALQLLALLLLLLLSGMVVIRLLTNKDCLIYRLGVFRRFPIVVVVVVLEGSPPVRSLL